MKALSEQVAGNDDAKDDDDDDDDAPRLLSDKECHLMEDVEFFLLLSQRMFVTRSQLGLRALLEWKIRPKFYPMQGFEAFLGTTKYSNRLMKELNDFYWKVYPRFHATQQARRVRQ